jgi:hypothetical protein
MWSHIELVFWVHFESDPQCDLAAIGGSCAGLIEVKFKK